MIVTEARARYGELDVYRTSVRPLRHTLSGRDENGGDGMPGCRSGGAGRWLWSWHHSLRVSGLGSGGCDRTEAHTSTVVPAGTFDTTRHEVEAKLALPQKGVGPLHFTEDDEGG